MATATPPPTHRALVLSSFAEGPQIQTVPTPQPTPGSAVIQVLATGVLPYASALFSGKLNYPLSLPMTIGSSAIARIAAVGPDATTLQPGQLVLFEVFVHGRDKPEEAILFGTHGGISAGARKLMDGEWRDATYAEFARVPLENCHVLNEEKLIKGLGYSAEDLAYLLRQIVPMGGLVELDVKAGETVIVAPATGAFGGAAVEVAMAMGATVVAAARNIEALQSLAKISDRVKIVHLKGDTIADAQALQQFGEVDAYLDFSPAAASKSTHIASCLMALKTKGSACFMGGIQETVAIPYGLLMFRSLQLRGKFMYEREATKRLIKMAESGLLKLGEGAGLKTVGPYSLEDWKDAFEAAEKNAGWGYQTLLAPQKN